MTVTPNFWIIGWANWTFVPCVICGQLDNIFEPVWGYSCVLCWVWLCWIDCCQAISLVWSSWGKVEDVLWCAGGLLDISIGVSLCPEDWGGVFGWEIISWWVGVLGFAIPQYGHEISLTQWIACSNCSFWWQNGVHGSDILCILAKCKMEIVELQEP